MIEPRLFTAEEIERSVRPAPKRAEWFVVVAYNCASKLWSLNPAGLRKFYFTDIAARSAAASLAAIWTYIDIIRIPGGAEKTKRQGGKA